MSLFVSYRDITFVPSDTGVRIIVTTDVACHVWLRVTLQQPWVHKQASYIRGLAIQDDVRFCFVTYHDNEQFEDGDTLIHTFYKTDWPVCTTKWFYPFASIGGSFVVSTGPFFEYHNTGESPVPSPDAMYHLNSIDPEYHSITPGGVWTDYDLSYDIPLGASGAILYLENSNAGDERRITLRKPSATYSIYTEVGRRQGNWVIVGLDADRKFSFLSVDGLSFHFYVMGYTGPKVVFPDTPLDIKPLVDDAYSTIDIGATWPDARHILTDLGSNDGWGQYHSIRPLGSSKEYYQGSFHKWPFCVVPVSGKIETKLYRRSHASTQWLAYAYIPTNVYSDINGIDLGALPAGAWTSKNAGGLSADSRWVFVEQFHPISSAQIGIRKRLSYFGDLGFSQNHNWQIAHVNDSALFEMYSSLGAPTQLLLAST